MINIIKHISQHKIKLLVLLVIVFEFILPYNSFSAETNLDQSILLPNLIIRGATGLEIEDSQIRLAMPDWQPNPDLAVVQTYRLTVTAYSSTPDQTDSTPCLTANDFNLCENNQENTIAANFLPFGTKVRIPEYFGDKIFTVQDRMNARYYYRADVWMKSRQSAIRFGAKYTVLEVLE